MSHQNHSYLIIENTMIVTIPERLVAEMSELPGVLDTEISWNSIEFYRILWNSMGFYDISAGLCRAARTFLGPTVR